MELKEKELKDGDIVEFDWNDSKAPSKGQSYGKAGFIICPIWKYGKLKRVFIYPKQQRNVEYYYKVECGYSNSMNIQSWTYKGIEEPKVWFFTWCKEHKTQSFYCYVPRHSKRFSINILSTFCINFDN